ncbi:hypothetical protein TWF730_011339 [Orbilia blumenaviensis]|uniref:DNA 3'-5' helicase n=1 Tax=Orbilia blumenaviensis TaxID=1796055 RepID=A0AAV9UNI4_9PEZI
MSQHRYQSAPSSLGAGKSGRRTGADFTALPLETLLHIAGYLSNGDVATFARALPYINPLIARKPFHRWQRLVGTFTYRLNDTFDAIENGPRQKASSGAPRLVNAASVVPKVCEAAEFQDSYIPQVLAEMRIHLENEQPVQLDDIFLSLRKLGDSPGMAFSPLVDCADAEEGSKRLRSALDTILPVELVKSLLPSAISLDIHLIPSANLDFILLTGYLLFTELQPKDIVKLLPRYSGRGYISEQALAEYLSYFLLFLKVFRLNSACVLNVMRSVNNEMTDRVQWKFTNGSPLSGQSLQILQRRIESWFADFHEAQIYPIPDSKKPPLTREQRLFVDFDIQKSQVFKVRAYAGTGKTKCLVDYASKRPRKRILYVAYNRLAKLDADYRFKDCYNVDCKTLHSVAFNALSVVNPDVDLQVKGKVVSGPDHPSAASSRRGTLARISSAPVENNFLQNWDIDVIAKSMRLTLDIVAPVFTTKYEWPGEYSSWMSFMNSRKPAVGTPKNPKNVENLVRIITTGIDKFCNSRDPEPTVAHLSLSQCRTKVCNPDLAVNWLKRLWKMIMLGKSPLMTHDCYLKMFSLTTNPEADQITFGKYDIVMFDEAQDANPCMANIILRQREAAGIIIIGDPYQMIYGFRGAKNECFDDEKLPPTQTFHLTKSFRFGQEVADIANLILGTVGETKLVRGGNSSAPSPAVFLPPAKGSKDFAPINRHTVIFRTNTKLVQYFFSSFAKYPNKTMCLKTSAANASTLIIPLLRAGYFLYKGKPPKHPRLRGVTSFEEAKAYVQREENCEGPDSDDVDLPALALVVGMEKYYQAESEPNGSSFLEMLESSSHCIVDVEKQADIVLTTAHQSKGLEWDDVIVAEDFRLDGLDRQNATAHQAWSNEAINLIYVACTRARERLQLCQGLAHFLVRRLGTSRFFVSPESNSVCPCCRGRQPFNTFLGGFLTDTDAINGTDISNYLSAKPSPCIGYEALVPRRDPSSPNGWIDPQKRPLNPAEIPNGVYLPAIACVNCILSWRSLTNRMHGDLFRFADGIKGRIGFVAHPYHSDYHIFWAGRFPPGTTGHLGKVETQPLQSAYNSKMRMGLEDAVNIGLIDESRVAWCDFVFAKIRDTGAEYDDEDIDEFIKTFEG